MPLAVMENYPSITSRPGAADKSSRFCAPRPLTDSDIVRIHRHVDRNRRMLVNEFGQGLPRDPETLRRPRHR